MTNSLFLQTLANFERECFAEFWRTSHSSFCVSLTACALPPATIALSHAEGLRRTADDSGRVPRSSHKQKRLLLHFDVADGTPLGMLNWSFVHGNLHEPHGQAGFGQHQPLLQPNRYFASLHFLANLDVTFQRECAVHHVRCRLGLLLRRWYHC